MCLSASLSEKEEMSVAGFLAACSKLLKGTLRVYTTSSDSSGLSLDTPGWDDTHRNPSQSLLAQLGNNSSLSVYLHYYFQHLVVPQAAILTPKSPPKLGRTTAEVNCWRCTHHLVLLLSPGFAFGAAGLIVWGAEVWRTGRALPHHAFLLPLHQDFTL